MHIYSIDSNVSVRGIYFPPKPYNSEVSGYYRQLISNNEFIKSLGEKKNIFVRFQEKDKRDVSSTHNLFIDVVDFKTKQTSKSMHFSSKMYGDENYTDISAEEFVSKIEDPQKLAGSLLSRIWSKIFGTAQKFFDYKEVFGEQGSAYTLDKGFIKLDNNTVNAEQIRRDFNSEYIEEILTPKDPRKFYFQ